MSFLKKRLTWVLCSFGSKLHLQLVLDSRRKLWPFKSPQLNSSSYLSFSVLSFVHFSFDCLLPPVQVWFYGWLLNDLQAYVSRDQTTVNAARSQSPLQSSLLFLGSEDCNDGLVKHRLQALLGQC